MVDVNNLLMSCDVSPRFSSPRSNPNKLLLSLRASLMSTDKYMRIGKVADDIARCVITAFQSLPAKAKPRRLDNGRKEWVPLAGIVLRKGKFILNLAYNRMLMVLKRP